MVAMPKVGEGSRDTRKDAVRWRATLDKNPVTRAVCRDIWADWIMADDDSICQLRGELRDLTSMVYGLRTDFDRLGARMGYGGQI